MQITCRIGLAWNLLTILNISAKNSNIFKYISIRINIVLVCILMMHNCINDNYESIYAYMHIHNTHINMFVYVCIYVYVYSYLFIVIHKNARG